MSEVEGPYELPEGWTCTTLGDIISLEYGKGLTKDKRQSEGNVPVYGSSGIVGYHTDCFTRGPSIIVGRKGSVGSVYLSKVPCWPIDTTYYIEPSAGVDLYYLFYLISSLNLEFLDKSTAIPGLNRNDAYSLPILLPPLPEQCRIVAKIEELFTQLDAGVSALEKSRAQLKRYRQSVLKAAVEGKLTEEWRRGHPDVEPASILLERIEREREKSGKGRQKKLPQLDTSGLPELPVGWVWVRWDQVGYSQNGRAFTSKEYQPNGFKLLRPGNLHASGKVVWTEKNTRYMPERWAEDYPDYIIRSGELVMNLTAQSLQDEFLGRVCVTSPSDICLLNQRIARLTPIEVVTEYLLYMFKSRLFRQFVNGLNTGSLIQHMFTTQLAEFVFPLPPLPEQHEIVSEIERRLSVADQTEATLEANLKRAVRLRQSILKKAFRGELVPQNPNDEPASVLLERIRMERSQTRPINNRGQARRGRGRPRKPAAVQLELI